MKKFISYFSYIMTGIVAGILIILFAGYCDFLPQKYETYGVYMQAAIYGIGYGVIILSFLKQKDEWFYYNEYPFKKKLIKFKFFKKKEAAFLKRKEEALRKTELAAKQKKERLEKQRMAASKAASKPTANPEV